MPFTSEVLDNVTQFCKTRYDQKTFEHARRVMIYASQNVDVYRFLSEYTTIQISCTALLHDIIEDTKTSYDDIKSYLSQSDDLFDWEIENLISSLRLLTHDKKRQTYDEYIINISNKRSFDVVAYAVKIADMKDHLSLHETLTTKLKNKYVKALAELL